MTQPDNSHHLRRAALARHDLAVERATEAIKDLDRAGTPITFTAVASAAGVSRSWLYTETNIRDAITRFRHTTASIRPPILAAQRATTDSLRARLDAARDEIRHLRAENADMHAQLARTLGDRRLNR
ncbi:MAG: DUF6262 family protein [Ilumatobacteraceae bacterium]